MEKRQNSRLSWGAALLIVILVTAIAFLGAHLYVRARSRGEFGTYARLDLPANQGLQPVGDGFVYYDGSSLLRMSSSGQTVWSHLVGANAQFDAQTTGVAAWSGDLLTLIGWEDGVVQYSSVLSTDIVSARMGGKYAAVLLAPETDGSLLLMEPGGRQVDTLEFNGQTVLDYGFFSDDSLFWVMSLDTSGTVPTCEISTYSPGKRIVGSISDHEQLMYQVIFRNSQLLCAGVTHLKVYDYIGTEQTAERKLIYGWYLVSADGNSRDPMMAYALNSQFDAGEGLQDVRMMRSNLDQTVRMPFGCASLVASGSRVYGFSKDGYIMIAKAGQQRVEAYPTGIAMDRVYGVTSDNVAVVGYGSQIYLINLP